MEHAPAPLRFWTTVFRSARLKCPRCGRGRLFGGLLRMNAFCGSCSLNFCPEPGYYVGAMYINYGMTVALGLLATFLLATGSTVRRFVPALLVFALVFPLVFFRFSRSFWLGLDLYISSRTFNPPPGAPGEQKP